MNDVEPTVAPGERGTRPKSGVEREVQITLTMKVGRRAMFLRNAGAEIEEGEFAGTDYATNAGGGHPVLTIKRDGKSLGTAWIGLQDLIGAMLPAAAAACDELNAAGSATPSGDSRDIQS